MLTACRITTVASAGCRVDMRDDVGACRVADLPSSGGKVGCGCCPCGVCILKAVFTCCLCQITAMGCAGCRVGLQGALRVCGPADHRRGVFCYRVGLCDTIGTCRTAGVPSNDGRAGRSCCPYSACILAAFNMFAIGQVTTARLDGCRVGGVAQRGSRWPPPRGPAQPAAAGLGMPCQLAAVAAFCRHWRGVGRTHSAQSGSGAAATAAEAGCSPWCSGGVLDRIGLQAATAAQLDSLQEWRGCLFSISAEGRSISGQL
jgi:hypothetical protein